ncbi:MAG: hypothetical protein QNJ15_04870 [Erythrobacter sp.]|nr:hypothetical protein [Erythrobacter sp.]
MTELATAIAATLLAMQGQPAAPAEQTESAETAEQADENKIICRRTAITGSKFKKKICGTKKEWETLATRGARDTRELQRRGKGNEPVN